MKNFKKTLAGINEKIMYLNLFQTSIIVHPAAVLIMTDAQQTCHVLLLFRPHRNA